MLRIILYGLLIWFVYNLIFKLVIPVYRTTKQVKRKFREMHERMKEEEMKQAGFYEKSSSATPSASADNNKDYIDFEEIE